MMCRCFFANILLLLIGVCSLFSQAEYFWTEPVNLRNLNSSADDFAPSWNKYENRLYFASTRQGNSKLFVSRFSDTITFAKPEILKDPLNLATKNLSYIAFLNETQALLNTFRRGKKQSYLNLFYSLRRLGSWQIPIILDSLACECFVLHPTVSTDGRTIIFSANYGDKADLDLYSATLQPEGYWSNVQSLVEINTDGNEITPFLLDDDTLFFASDGYGGPGSYDIYYSVKRNGYWDKPIPLNEINTRYNESDFIIINSSIGIFASDRPEGLGGLDLYVTYKTEREVFVANQAIANIKPYISVSVPFIRVVADYEYSLCQMPSSFNIQNLSFNFSQEYFSEEIDLSKCESNFNLELLRVALFRLCSAKIPCKIKLDTTNSLIYETIKTQIQRFCGNEHKISYLHWDSGSADSLYLVFDYDRISNPVRFGQTSFSFEPEQFEAFLSATNTSVLRAWELTIPTLGLAFSGDSLPVRIMIDLQKAKIDNINSFDSINLVLSVWDTTGHQTSEAYQILVNKFFRSVGKTISYKNKVFTAFYFVTPVEQFVDSPSESRFFGNIIQNARTSSIIIIHKEAPTNLNLLSEFLNKSYEVPTDRISLISKKNLPKEIKLEDFDWSFVLLVEASGF